MKPALFFSFCALLGWAAVPAVLHGQAAANTVPVLMLSDIHFDPFHDPAKVAALREAPATEWEAILEKPASPTQVADFTALQKACKAKGLDTSYPLLVSSLQAERSQGVNPLFVTVSGDLMAHQFDCRFRTLAPGGTAADYSAFAAKTVAFLGQQLRRSFPGAPIYFALGNNDSSCKDYAEDPNSAFLTTDARSFAIDAVSLANASAILHEAPHLGDQNILLPEPFRHTHLLILQDIFQAKRYTNCAGTKVTEPAKQQMEWLRTQLTAARDAHEHVWVMAHMPPGIDAYSTFSKGRNVCGADDKPAEDPEMFLSSESLAETLSEFADVIRLALFGHTHMDEMRVYRGKDDAVVPGKLVPSISPVDGNDPAFTVARVDAATATLVDYSVIAAAHQTGDVDAWDHNPKWAAEYRFSTTYGLEDFSGGAIRRLMLDFSTDIPGSDQTSRDYQNYYFAGDASTAGKGKAAALGIVWPAYVCSMTQSTIVDFRTCVCHIPKVVAPPTAN